MNLSTKSFNKLKLLIIAIIISSLIATGGALLYKHEQESIRTEKYNELKAIAELKTNQLAQWKKERLSEVSFFSTNQPLIQSVTKLKHGDSKSIEYINTSLSHILSYNRYDNIFILNRNGEVIFNLDSAFVEVDSFTISKSNQTITKNEIVFTDFFRCNIHNSVHFDIIAPIQNNYGEVFATLVFRVKPADYLFPLIQYWPTPSKTAESILLKKEDNKAVFINSLRHIDDAPLTLKIPLSKTEIPAVKAILGLDSSYEGIDYRQQEVLSVTNPVPGTSWYMVTKVDKDEIFEDLYFRSALITAITILLIFITGATLAWFYLYRQRNLYKMLLDKELQLHQSQQEFHATIYSMGDGVITTNNQGLVQQMNPVAERLTGWQESEAKGQNIEEIFRIINEDTLSKVENPVSKVLIEGSIVNLANHTLLISKDGKEIPISDSGAPIKDKKGRVIGVVLIFKDQTEERAQENALKESQERFQQLFINAPLGYQSLDNNGKFLEVNQQWLNTLGYSKDEIIGKNFSTFIAPEHQDIFSKQFQTLKDQGHIHSEFEMLHKNGEKRIIALDGRIGYSKAGEFIQSHCIIQDITEKKKTEKDLKNIEWMLTRQPEMFEESESMSRQEQSYGNLTLLNKGGLIKSSIDQSILHGIVNEYMILLETSSAIYEKNGDYAYGIFSSGWCQLMDQSSRNLCNTKNNAEALVSGKWLCHDSCWKDCSLKAIESEKPADIECNGGIHLYGVPIFANGEVVGVINFGYGNPPKDIDKLNELAELYKTDVDELKKKSEEYYSRPRFIVEIAKKRIKVSAKIIGMLIERKLAENSLRESEAKFRSLIESTPVGILLTDKNHRTLNVNKKFSETTGYTLDDIPTADDWWQKAYPDKVYRQDLKNQWDAAIKEALKTNSEIKPVETKVTCKSGTEKYFKIGSVNVGNINIVTFTDITEHKYHELEIKTSREFILSIIENLPIGLAVNTVEPNISFEFMNDNFARFYNLSKEELANPNAFWDTVYEDPKFREKIKNRILTDIKTGDPEKMKWTDIPIKRDGEIIRYVTARNIPLHDRGLVISTVWDVTERKMAEMEFVKLKDNLEVLVKEKTKELNERVAELERFHEATINREIRMKELKDEIKRLKNEQ